MKPIKYIIENERDLLWGLSINTVGYEMIDKGEKYPTNKHLDSYYFSPEKGRVLQEYQLIHISEGEGVLQTQSMEKTTIKAGPSHHCAIGLGHVANEIEKIAFLPGIPLIKVCG